MCDDATCTEQRTDSMILTKSRNIFVQCKLHFGTDQQVKVSVNFTEITKIYLCFVYF